MPYIKKLKPEHECRKPNPHATNFKFRFGAGTIWQCRKCKTAYKLHKTSDNTFWSVTFVEQ